MENPNLEYRIENLERAHTNLKESYDRDISLILKALTDIRNRLVGSLENNTTGIIEDIRLNKLELATIKEDIKILKENKIKSDEKLDKINSKLLVAGGIFVTVVWILERGLPLIFGIK